MKYYRQKKRPEQLHSDDWLMTFADMITLLLCFFVVFFSATAFKKTPVEKPVVKPPVEQVFIVPDILEGHLPFHGAQYTTALTGEDAVEAVPVKTVQPLPEVDHLKTQDNAKVEQKGDRITTLEMSSAAFFDSGSATLREAGKVILRDMAETLRSDKYKDYTVTVEGHTDDSPINTFQFPSNWELSTARASAVVHFFLEQGIPAQKLRAAGYADTFPKAPNRDASGNALPDNQAQNRRVVLRLDKIEKASK